MKKTGDRNFILRAAAAAAFATLASMAVAQPQVQGQVAVQQGPALKDMNAPRVPGDDRLDIQLPNGCQIKASATSGCDVIRCKAEEPIAINSARGITTAKTVATAKAKKALSDMHSGEVLKVLATDPGSVRDFQAFARQTGNELVLQEKTESAFVFGLKRR